MKIINLSIVIPTYNRWKNLKCLLEEILTFKGIDIEVIVVDNYSSDETEIEIKLIADKRLIYLRNESNIGAIANYLTALNSGHGKYKLFFTDKDHINVNNLDKFIQLLNENLDLVCGTCELDYQKSPRLEKYEKGYESIKNVAYLTKHPTGYFFKSEHLTQILKNVNFTNKILQTNFPFEFIIAQLCIEGSGSRVKMNLCNQEGMNSVKEFKSFSYSSSQNNLYFMPNEILKLTLLYVDDIYDKPLGLNSKFLLIINVIVKSLGLITMSFKRMIETEIIANHYNLMPRKVSSIEMLRNYIWLNFNLIKSMKFNFVFNFLIIIAAQISVLFKIFRTIFKF